MAQMINTAGSCTPQAHQKQVLTRDANHAIDYKKPLAGTYDNCLSYVIHFVLAFLISLISQNR